MKRVLAGFGLIFLTACAPEPPVLTAAEVFRDPAAQIASQTNVTSARMAGRWYIRQRFAGAGDITNPVEISLLPENALRMRVTLSVCQFSQCVEDVEVIVLMEPSGPGRWAPVDAPFGVPQQDIWVMWMDFDSRTMAIGTPTGEFGWIMDKNPGGGDDRITAARDIMEWFGYDTPKLREVPQ